MKEIPVLMKPDMAVASHKGFKTNTRRIIKNQHLPRAPASFKAYDLENGKFGFASDDDDFVCPYGKPGDILWVKEQHYLFGYWEKTWISKKGNQKWKFVPQSQEVKFPDDPPNIILPNNKRGPGWFKRNSLFMPRSAARTLLKVTDIRVERLQDISEEDAWAEGCDLEWYRDNAGTENLWPCPKCQGFQVHECPGANMGMSECDCAECDTAKKMFRHLWESINGPGSWHLNPWIWCIEFKKL